MKKFFSDPVRLWYIIAGLIIAALFAIVIPIDGPVVPVIFAVFIREYIRQWRSGDFICGNLIAGVFGGIVIQVFSMIGGGHAI